MKLLMFTITTMLVMFCSSGGVMAHPLRRRMVGRDRQPITQAREYYPDPEPVGRCYGSEYNYGASGVCGTATGGPSGGLPNGPQ